MGAAVILFLLASGLVLALRSPRAALLTAVFLAPWNGLQADFGVTVYAFQLIMLPLVIVVSLRWLTSRDAAVPAGGRLTAFAVYAVIVSLIVVGFLPETRLIGGPLRAPIGRAAIQIPVFLFAIAPAAVLPLMARRDDIAACGRVFIASSVVLALIGWGQLAVWYATGTNPIRISAISAALGGDPVYSHQGAFDFAQLTIYRMNAFGGEPRQLGVALVLAMLIVQAWALTAPRPRLWLLALWLFLLASALATYSTSAALLWLIGSMAGLAAMRLTHTPLRRSRRAVITAIVAVAAPLGIGIAVAQAQGIPVIALLSERTIDRIDGNGAVEDFDLAILGYLRAHPASAIAGAGLGNIHLYAAAYLDPQSVLYAGGSVFSAKSGYLRLISESGVIGLALFLRWYAGLMRQAAPAVRGTADLVALAPLGLVLLLLFLLRAEIGNEFWLTAGLLGAAARSRAVLA